MLRANTRLGQSIVRLQRSDDRAFKTHWLNAIDHIFRLL